MKKTILILCAMTFGAFTSFAQTEKGGFLVGASSDLNFSSTSVDGVDDNLNEFTLDVSGGYFLIDNLAAGIGLGYRSIKQGDVIDNSAFLIGVFGRYYVNSKIILGANYSVIDADGQDALSNLGFEGGYALFVKDNIAIEPTLNYDLGLGDNTANALSLNVGFTLYF